MNSLMNIDSASDSLSRSSLKPFEHINTLIEAIQTSCSELTFSKSHVIHYQESDERYCYLLIEGSVALHRRGDGIIMTSESAPFILGLSNQLMAEDEVYIRTLEACRISRVPLAVANEIIINNDMWMPLAKLLIYTTSRVYEHCARVQQLSAYDIIRFQLYELMNETDIFRLNTTAASYIKSRTYLARSGIMRILAELKAGDYIQMDRGILLNITHLPKKY